MEQRVKKTLSSVRRQEEDSEQSEIRDVVDEIGLTSWWTLYENM